MRFSYPLDASEIIKKKKSLRTALLNDGTERIKKSIAVLGGSTTNDIVSTLELFLLDYGIEPTFYQSEYGRFWQDAMFPPEELTAMKPDIIYIHTTGRNIRKFPDVNSSEEDVRELLDGEYKRFSEMWDKLRADFHCPIIQNNFELPLYRVMGNSEFSDRRGRVNYVTRLNARFAEYAANSENFYINDINYVSACYGLDKWLNPLYWNMYKYALAVPAIPDFCFNLSHIIKAMLGKNKKALALDLDNTLWGGVIGDDGAEGIALGEEVPTGQIYGEFQRYVREQRSIGVLLTVCSKNDPENALMGLRHPDGALKPEDFAVIKANWEPKDQNIAKTAEELNILPESIVFADDNPAERAIVREQLHIDAPELDNVEDYIRVIDRNGYFEVIGLSDDDLKRNEMYAANAKRTEEQSHFANYGQYLDSLEMTAVIDDFTPLYLQRITQLTNKSNQFNLTTRRYTPAEMAAAYDNRGNIRLYGKLTDKFGDNGVVSVVIAETEGERADIVLWLMSCRVLKREMEFAMLDRLVEEAQKRGIKELHGHYYPTAKNGMVRELYKEFGFELVSADEAGNTEWLLRTADYVKKTSHITLERN